MIQQATMDLEAPRTALLAKTLTAFDDERVLVVSAVAAPENLRLASRLLSDRFEFINVAREPFNVYHVLHAKRILMTPEALSQLQTHRMV